MLLADHCCWFLAGWDPLPGLVTRFDGSGWSLLFHSLQAQIIFLDCLSVILFTGGCTPPSQTTPEQTPPRKTLQRTLRILLECILVDHSCFIPCRLRSSSWTRNRNFLVPSRNAWTTSLSLRMKCWSANRRSLRRRKTSSSATCAIWRSRTPLNRWAQGSLHPYSTMPSKH